MSAQCVMDVLCVAEKANLPKISYSPMRKSGSGKGSPAAAGAGAGAGAGGRAAGASSGTPKTPSFSPGGGPGSTRESRRRGGPVTPIKNGPVPAVQPQAKRHLAVKQRKERFVERVLGALGPLLVVAVVGVCAAEPVMTAVGAVPIFFELG